MRKYKVWSEDNPKTRSGEALALACHLFCVLTHKASGSNDNRNDGH